MTRGIRQTIRDLTGWVVDTCPWRAFHDPFVGRVLSALRFDDTGNLAFAVPNASHRLVEGIDWYRRVDGSVRAKLWDMERAARQKGQARG